MKMYKNTLHGWGLLLAAVIAGSLAIRLWPVRAGLPYSFWLDEVNYVEAALRVGTGNLAMTSYCHGGMFQLILFAEYALYYLSLLVFGIIRSASGFLFEYIKDPSVFFIMARATVALMSTCIVLLSYKIASEIYNRRTGVITAIFTGFSFLFIQMSFFGLADIPSVFFLLLAYLALVYSIKRPAENRLYYLASLLVGMAIACKYHTVFGAAGLFLAAFIKFRDGLLSIKRLLYFLAFGSIFAAIGFLIGMPFFTVNIAGFCSDALVKNAGEYIGKNPFKDSWLIYFTRHMPNGLGIPLELVSIAGILYACRRRTKWDILMLSFPVSYYILFMNSNVLAYHILPAVPFILILAARILDAASDKYFIRNSSFACLVLACAVTAPTFFGAMKYVEVVLSADTRVTAKRWMEENIPGGAAVMVEGYIHRADVHNPPLVGDLKTLESDLQYMKSQGSSGRNVSVKISNFDRLYKGAKIYNVIKEDSVSADGLIKYGPEYVILTGDNDYAVKSELSHFVSERYILDREHMKKTLESGYELIKSFYPSDQLSFAFPHLLARDYAIIEKRPIYDFSNYIKGPKIDIFKKRE